MRPIIKWAGGKTRLLLELGARFPTPIEGCFYEPFAGGAAVFWDLELQRAVLGDLNADLIGLYTHVRDLVEPLIALLARHERDHDERHYYAVRSAFNGDALSPLERAAAFLYLNKTCFNGLWRVNRAGEFNVPMGRYEKPQICAPNLLRRASTVLAPTQLRIGSYRETTAGASAGDLVYLDPPYDPLTPTSFTRYAGEFGAADQADLASYALELAARGCHVVASNADTERVRDLWRGWQIDRVMCARAINSDSDHRGEVAEVIITRPTAARRGKRADTMDTTTDDTIIQQGILLSLPVKLSQAQLLEVAQDKARREQAVRQIEVDLADTTRSFKRRIAEQETAIEKLGGELVSEEREVPTLCYSRYRGGMIEIVRTDTLEVCERRTPTMAERQKSMPLDAPRVLGGLDADDLIEREDGDQPEPEPEPEPESSQDAQGGPIVFAGALEPGAEEKPSGRKRRDSGSKAKAKAKAK